MNISPQRVIAEAMLDKKAKDVVSLDLREIGTAITDHFVICNADSTTAVSAISDNIIDKMRERLSRKPLRTQGLENGFWVILDYGEVVVHVFLTEYRAFYRLEDLWADAKKKTYTEEELFAKKAKKEAAAEVPKVAKATVKKTAAKASTAKKAAAKTAAKSVKAPEKSDE